MLCSAYIFNHLNHFQMSDADQCLELLSESRFCADPFVSHKKKVSTNLRDVTEHLVALPVERVLHLGQKVCTNCLKRLQKFIPKENSGSTSSESDIEARSNKPGSSASCQLEAYEEEKMVEDINVSLSGIGESPVEKKRLKRSRRYGMQKVEKSQSAVARQLQMISPHDISRPHSTRATDKPDHRDENDQSVDREVWTV